MRTHACNLGGLIAEELASSLPHCPAYIADPGVVDELEEVPGLKPAHDRCRHPADPVVGYQNKSFFDARYFLIISLAS